MGYDMSFEVMYKHKLYLLLMICANIAKQIATCGGPGGLRAASQLRKRKQKLLQSNPLQCHPCSALQSASEAALATPGCVLQSLQPQFLVGCAHDAVIITRRRCRSWSTPLGTRTGTNGACSCWTRCGSTELRNLCCFATRRR